MNEELRSRMIRTWKGAIEQGNLAGLDTILAPDILVHTPPYPDIVGRETCKRLVSETRANGSGHVFAVSDWMSEGALVVVRWEWRYHFWYANTVPHWGLPRTGKAIVLKGLTMMRVANQKEVERWDYIDRLGFLQQLGVVPVVGAASDLRLAS